MKKRILKSALMAVLGVGLLAGSAMALTYGSIPGEATNDLLGFGNAATGWYGATLYSVVAQDLTFTYLGKEAGYINLFQVYKEGVWSQLFTTDGSIIGATGSLNVAAGEIIKFRFVPNGVIANAVTNGSNPDDAGGAASVNFFTTNTPYTINNGTGNDLISGMWGLWLDDAGAGPDDNHDDMLIGLTGNVNVVPEPATMLLFGAGVAGLAGVARRRKEVLA